VGHGLGQNPIGKGISWGVEKPPISASQNTALGGFPTPNSTLVGKRIVVTSSWRKLTSKALEVRSSLIRNRPCHQSRQTVHGDTLSSSHISPAKYDSLSVSKAETSGLVMIVHDELYHLQDIRLRSWQLFLVSLLL